MFGKNGHTVARCTKLYVKAGLGKMWPSVTRKVTGIESNKHNKV
jgi:hypothetical protein